MGKPKSLFRWLPYKSPALPGSLPWVWIPAVEVAADLREDRPKTDVVGMRVFVAGKLIQRTWQDNAGKKRHTVEIQVTHVGPDLQLSQAWVGARSWEATLSEVGSPESSHSRSQIHKLGQPASPGRSNCFSLAMSSG